MLRSIPNRVIRRLAFLALLALVTMTGCGSDRASDDEQWTPEERIVLRFSHVVAENTPKGLAARRFAELAQEKTNGLVEIKIFPNGELIGDGEAEIRALLNGQIHFIAPSTGKLAESFPVWQVFDLPYAFADERAVNAAMKGPIGERLFTVLRSRGLHGLTMWENGWKQMTSAKHPLRDPSDFAGQRFRIQPTRILAEQFKTVGAVGVPLPFDQTYRALAAGQVDGQENTTSNIYSKKFHEVQRHMTLSNHGYLGYVVMTSATQWGRLPAPVQIALEEAMAESTEWVRLNAGRLNAENLELIAASGLMEIHVQTEAERAAWRAAFRPVYDLFAKGIDRELVEAVQQLGQPR
jgi:C4-dicarboxylate-binding protein DctP